ncbi:BnaA02g09530D [Brassica napus]|uniref:BnaA02g09530D protein n=1 Tax=Brassica napus TaxID=3708 RepID=A0A078GTD4_BRANA|nr:BnaA02g09530D [Brassica napus]
MDDSNTRSQTKKTKKLQKDKNKNKKNNIPTVWFSLKKSLHCKSEPSDVHVPKSTKHLTTISTKRISTANSSLPSAGCGGGLSGCSRSIANLKDVIHGSKRHFEKPPISSPRSIGSNEFLNPITHEVILSNSTCELKITGVGDMASPAGATESGGGGGGNGRSTTFVGMLRPGTPMHHLNHSASHRSHASVSLEMNRDSAVNGGKYSVSCHKCGEQFNKLEAAEAHHLSKHAVTELVEGDSSRKIVEIICRTSWLKSENQCGRIDRVLKVHNMQKTLARFEEYRETVKIRASKLQKKHPRCLADGNELLRFHGTTVACGLGINGSTSLCTAEKCCVCRIIRNGFSAKREKNNGVGVFTASTSGRAFESILVEEGDGERTVTVRKVLIVCRVIAGRVHRPVENVEEMNGLMMSGFDSLAGKVGLYTNVEELYLLNPRALLPCFVVICKS